MSRARSIPLGVLPTIFKKFGYLDGEVTTLMTILLMMCRTNEETYLEDIISEFIRTEMDLDPLQAQIFILEALPTLLDIGTQFRRLALTGHLLRYDVFGYTILLEVDDDYSNLQPLSVGPTTD
jgi:hypothetical protein